MAANRREVLISRSKGEMAVRCNWIAVGQALGRINHDCIKRYESLVKKNKVENDGVDTLLEVCCQILWSIFYLLIYTYILFSR